MCQLSWSGVDVQRMYLEGRWRNDVIVGMAMSASAVGWYHFPYLPIVTYTENNPCIQTVIRIATEIYSVVHWPIANIHWNFHVNPFRRFCAKLLSNRQTDRQTNDDENITLAEVINRKKTDGRGGERVRAIPCSGQSTSCTCFFPISSGTSAPSCLISCHVILVCLSGLISRWWFFGSSFKSPVQR